MKVRIIAGYGDNRDIEDIENVAHVFTNEENGTTYLYTIIHENGCFDKCVERVICLDDFPAVYLLPF